MKTKEQFIKHIKEGYFIQTYVVNKKLYFEIFSRQTNKTYVKGVFMSCDYCALINNEFLTHPDFNHLFTADIIKDLVINSSIKRYTEYELTQNC